MMVFVTQAEISKYQRQQYRTYGIVLFITTTNTQIRPFLCLVDLFRFLCKWTRVSV